MSKIDWKRKLTSRKFWAAIVAFVTLLLIAFGFTEAQASQVASIIMAGATVIAYIIGEGLVDAANKAEAKKDLESRNAVLAEAYNAERNLRRLEEQNRLYDSIQKKTRKQINMLSKLLKDYRNADSYEKRGAVLKRIIVLGVYIKRRNNLIFINEQSNVIPMRELELCFEETVKDLELAGIRSSCFITAGDEIPTDIATEIYDFYEKICEELYGKMDSLLIRIFREKGRFAIAMDVSGEGVKLIGSFDTEVSEEDGVFTITRRFGEVAE